MKITVNFGNYGNRSITLDKIYLDYSSRKHKYRKIYEAVKSIVQKVEMEIGRD